MKKIWLLFVVLLIFCFSGCDSSGGGDKEEEYTVWTDVETYAEFQAAFGTTIEDGYYIRLEFTSSQWAAISPGLTSEYRHSWTKSQIKDWLIGRGFGDYESTKESAWMTTIDHGFIVSRTGQTVYYILK